MSFCANCGTGPVTEGWSFCANCGVKVGRELVPASKLAKVKAMQPNGE